MFDLPMFTLLFISFALTQASGFYIVVVCDLERQPIRNTSWKVKSLIAIGLIGFTIGWLFKEIINLLDDEIEK